MTSHMGGYSILKDSLKLKHKNKDKPLDSENKKYESTLKILQSQNKKYFDDMFPPGSASLFHSKTLTNARKDIRWMRVEDIYRGQKLVLYNHGDRNIVKTG